MWGKVFSTTFGGFTPDITPAQVVSLITAVVAQFVAYGVLGTHLSQLITSIAGIVIPFGMVLADAIIRHGRAQMVAAGRYTMSQALMDPTTPEAKHYKAKHHKS